MGEADHEAPVFDGDEGDGSAETGGQKIEKFTVAAVLTKGFELGTGNKRSNYGTAVFHAAIIASLLLLATGCGYKTDPVYVPPAEQNQTGGTVQ